MITLLTILLLTTWAGAELWITEVFYLPAGTYPLLGVLGSPLDLQFIELWNSGGEDVSLDEYSIRSEGLLATFDQKVLPPDGVGVVVGNTTAFRRVLDPSAEVFVLAEFQVAPSKRNSPARLGRERDAVRLTSNNGDSEVRRVNYRAGRGGWPTITQGGGLSIMPVDVVWAANPASWRADLPSPGVCQASARNLRITEYSGVDGPRFVEITNMGDGVVNLEDVRLQGDVSFQFPEVMSDALPPKGVMLLVNDVEAFVAHYRTLYADALVASWIIFGGLQGNLSESPIRTELTWHSNVIDVLNFVVPSTQPAYHTNVRGAAGAGEEGEAWWVPSAEPGGSPGVWSTFDFACDASYTLPLKFEASGIAVSGNSVIVVRSLRPLYSLILSAFISIIPFAPSPAYPRSCFLPLYLAANDLYPLISDDGGIYVLDRTTHRPIHYVTVLTNPKLDLEDMTIADGRLFLAVEQDSRTNESVVVELDVMSNAVLRRFTLPELLVNTEANDGMEALAFVPVANFTEGGYFLAGSQANGYVYIYDLPIRSSLVGFATISRLLATWQPPSGYKDLASLSVLDSTLYLSYPRNGRRVLQAYSLVNGLPQDVLLWETVLPLQDAEGIEVVRGAAGVEIWAVSDTRRALSVLSLNEEDGTIGIVPCNALWRRKGLVPATNAPSAAFAFPVEEFRMGALRAEENAASVRSLWTPTLVLLPLINVLLAAALLR